MRLADDRDELVLGIRQLRLTFRQEGDLAGEPQFEELLAANRELFPGEAGDRLLRAIVSDTAPSTTGASATEAWGLRDVFQDSVPPYAASVVRGSRNRYAARPPRSSATAELLGLLRDGLTFSEVYRRLGWDSKRFHRAIEVLRTVHRVPVRSSAEQKLVAAYSQYDPKVEFGLARETASVELHDGREFVVVHVPDRYPPSGPTGGQARLRADERDVTNPYEGGSS